MAGRKLFDTPGLADAIGALREEVIRAQEEAQGSQLSFRVGPVEMEFEVALARASDYRGGLRVLVVTEDSTGGIIAESSKGEVTTHRVRLTLEPFDESGRPAALG
jgi:hypothetical protein